MNKTQTDHTSTIDFIRFSLESLQKKNGGREPGRSSMPLAVIAEEIVSQLESEELKMVEMGRPLPPVHLEEHEKMRQDIWILEFRWKARCMDDREYIRALSYKLEFHQYYFNRFIPEF